MYQLLVLSLNHPPGTLSGTRVGVSPLPANRQPTPVANAPVGTEVHETFYIHGHFTAQIALYGIFLNFRSNLVEFFLGEILNLNFGLDSDRLANLSRGGCGDAIYRRLRNPRVLAIGYVYTSDSSHFTQP
jgi:hypothetical protein